MATGSNSNSQIPQLSCEACRDRKIRCDKRHPCSNCQRAKQICVPVYRQRLPRGRHVHRNRNPQDKLKDRVNRLEAIISSMNPISTAGDKVDDSSSDQQRGQDSGQVDQHFWNDLVEEVQGLRGLVDHSPEESEEPGTDELAPSHTSHRVIGLGSTSPFLALKPTLAGTALLGEIYLNQVDPIIKILHRPSLTALMTHGSDYLKYERGHPAVEALICAVCYAAVNSMTDDQCQSMLHGSKLVVVLDYRTACESALERANLLITEDITVLQAFVLYLIANRFQEKSRAVWTLLPVAVRIAQALSLHLDRPHDSFFNRQMKKRLWYTICLLDLQCSFQQASQPLINPGYCPQLGLPANVNDSDFGQDFDGEIPAHTGLTDMTFALVAHSAQLHGRVLNFPSLDEIDKSRPESAFDWNDRISHARQFEEQVSKILENCDPEASPYAWFAVHGAQSLVASMYLSALRPLHRAGQNAPPRVQGSSQLLQLAGGVLEKAQMIHNDPRGERFRWYVVVQWHALAIAISECYISDDIALMRWIWPLIEGEFARHRKGALQRPLQKIMDRTRKRIFPLLIDLDMSLTDENTGSSGFVAGGSVSFAKDPSFECQFPSLSLGSSDQCDEIPQDMEVDPSWEIWSEFVNDFSFDGINVSLAVSR